MSRLERLGWRKAPMESQRASWVHGTSRRRRSFFGAAVKGERGQALIWVVMVLFATCLLLAVCAFALDIGHAYVVRKQLQASSDAAALAAAWHLTDGTYQSVATTYSSVGTHNSYGGYTVDTPVITARCSTTVSTQFKVPCGTYGNVVTVQETAHMGTFFAAAIGIKTLTVTAISAASKGANPTPFNIAIILDTTGSMKNTDSNCGNKTQEACAESAMGIILNGLDPTEDRVALFTFPAMEVGSAQNDTNCSGSQPTGEPYTFPYTDATSLVTMPYSTTTTGWNGKQTTTTVQTTYEITGFDTGYKSSYTATSLTSSGDPLVNAIGQSSGCRGLTENTTQNTYFAATIYAAQAALLAEQAANKGSANAMIILSDGNATGNDNSVWNDLATGTSATTGCTTDPSGSGQLCQGANTTSGNYAYPSLYGQCGQAVLAAQSATAAGTTVFTIAYGSPSTSAAATNSPSNNNGNCSNDITQHGVIESAYPNITPCEDMQDMSSNWPTDTTHFFSDYYDAAQGDVGCQASGPNNTITSLNDIAEYLVSIFTKSRLIPPNTP